MDSQREGSRSRWQWPGSLLCGSSRQSGRPPKGFGGFLVLAAPRQPSRSRWEPPPPRLSSCSTYKSLGIGIPGSRSRGPALVEGGRRPSGAVPMAGQGGRGSRRCAAPLLSGILSGFTAGSLRSLPMESSAIAWMWRERAAPSPSPTPCRAGFFHVASSVLLPGSWPIPRGGCSTDESRPRGRA